MTSYSIADLEQISGTKAHKLWVLEQRYDALKQMRSPGNTRSYDTRQLQKQLNVVSLGETGKSVSAINGLSEKKIRLL